MNATDDPALKKALWKLILRLDAVTSTSPQWVAAMDRKVEIVASFHREATYFNLFAKEWWATYIRRRPYTGDDEVFFGGDAQVFSRDCVAFALVDLNSENWC